MSLRSLPRGFSNGDPVTVIPPACFTTIPPAAAGRFNDSKRRHYDWDLEKVLNAMEKGHRICKLAIGKRWETTYRRLYFARETRTVILTKTDDFPKTPKPSVVDIRHVKEAQTLDYKFFHMRISDKWKRDRELMQFDAAKILVIQYGSNFILNNWICLMDTSDACRLWVQGLQHLMKESYAAPHPLLIERWLRKEFYNIANPNTQTVSAKHMKPFVQGRLQCKIPSKTLHRLIDDHMAFEAFANACRKLIHQHPVFSDHFAAYSDDGRKVEFHQFLRFLLNDQKDELGNNKVLASDFLRSYIKGVDIARDTAQPYLTVQEFEDFLFSRENSIWNPAHQEVTQNMDRPICDYWIASSHNTYLTGDQLKSESSLDCYSRALLMGCRCIELDCWPGNRRGCIEADIVIYHGYTMTTKIALRDVLCTIKEYAFIVTDYPLILSIEDNCPVQFQRMMAHDFKDCLGELLLTEPTDVNETCLPSPSQMKKKIILKHKKLPQENEKIHSAVSLSSLDDSGDADLMSKQDFIKKGVLQMRDEDGEWFQHIFILFSDKLCYTKDHSANEIVVQSGADGVSQMGEDEQDDFNISGIRPDEMHITEEWFHGKITREDAVSLLKKHSNLGDGLFLIRESNTFVGDFSLSFLFKGQVHHCRIKTKMIEGEKRYYFLDSKIVDTLYELISFYMEKPLNTPNFKTQLVTPCPQPQPYLNESWFAGKIGKAKAEDMLNSYREDGAFLIRYSTQDSSVFVLSLRVDGEIFHYRLKRDGRIFIVNQTVFENLNSFVKYYQEHEIARGIPLKYPVNAESIEMYTQSDMSYHKEGCYMELTTVPEDILVRAKFGNISADSAMLTFPIDAIITVLKKDDPYRWKGRYNGRTGWFLSDGVEPVEPGTASDFRDYGTLDLVGCLVERMDGEVCLEKPYVFRVYQGSCHWDVRSCIVAANTSEDMMDWINTLLEASRSAADKEKSIKTKENVLRIASELSNLVVYCQAVPYPDPEKIPGNFYEMCSFSESKLPRLVERGLTRFNQNQLSRCYPQGSRVRSTNFNPMPMWNSGVQMVALNYQTPDKAMQLNWGKFGANGRCGYVLKPEMMRLEGFDPENAISSPITLTIQVIAGRHLSRMKDRSRGGIVSPAVEIEIYGIPTDSQSMKTRAVASDGLHPIWNQQFEFNIQCPELALLRCNVFDDDLTNEPFIGQAVIPVSCMRGGYRSICLNNDYCEPLELASILVNVDIKGRNETESRYLKSQILMREVEKLDLAPNSPKQKHSDSVSAPLLVELGRQNSARSESDIASIAAGIPGPDLNGNERSESTSSETFAVKKKSSGIKRFFKGLK